MDIVGNIPEITAAVVAVISLVIAIRSSFREYRNELRYNSELAKIDTTLKLAKEEIETNRAALKKSAYADLANQIAGINNAFLTHDVTFPVSDLSALPKEEAREHSRRIIMMLLQLNLFYTAYLQRTLIDPEDMSRYKNWFRFTVLPYIRANKYTEEVYNKNILAGKDLIRADFVQYLQEISHAD